MSRQQKKESSPDPDRLSPEEQDRIKNLSDDELFEEMMQEVNELHQIDPGGHLTSPKFTTLVNESIERADKVEDKEEPVFPEDKELELYFQLMDKIRRRRTQPSQSPPGNTTTEHIHEGCPQRGKEPDITP
jgi:hypothetical protein